ncbi:MAG TPA: rhodanese-like domain-containing protein [Acidobacteriaceae bacterium]|nr:rhodanese-like domain-containing protein [Acidobacteriaceae bacterium]
MLLIVVVSCVVVLLAIVLIKRKRDREELEQHGITPEDLHTLLTSNQDVALYDVRLPLDLLGDSVVIPGAEWLAPTDVIANPWLIARDRDAIVYCTCASEKTARAVLRRAMAMGFMRVRILKGGIEGWKSKGFPVEPYNKPFHLGSGGSTSVAAG